MATRKLTDAQAREAFNLCKTESVNAVARRFGMAPTAIMRLKEGMTYRHLGLTAENTILLWGDPPPVRKNLMPQTRLRQTVAQLRNRPNTWANIHSAPGLNRENHRPHVSHWEAAGLEVTVSWLDGTWNVHARWPEFAGLAAA